MFSMCVVFQKVFLDPTFVKQERQSLNIDMFIIVLILGGGFKYFLCSPRSLGKLPILTSIFFNWVFQPTNCKSPCFTTLFWFQLGFKTFQRLLVVTEIHGSIAFKNSMKPCDSVPSQLVAGFVFPSTINSMLRLFVKDVCKGLDFTDERSTMGLSSPFPTTEPHPRSDSSS